MTHENDELSRASELGRLLDRANSLYLALERCPRICNESSGKAIIVGIMDLLSHAQDELIEYMEDDHVNRDDLDLIAAKTAELYQRQHDIPFGTQDYAGKQSLDQFISRYRDPVTGIFEKTTLPNRIRVQEFYRSGALKHAYFERDGNKDGSFISFYPTGDVNVISLYRRGQAVGIHLTFDLKGNISSRWQLEDPEWFIEDPKKHLDMINAYEDKFKIFVPPNEDDENIGFGWVIAGSLITVALTTLLNSDSKAEVQREQVQQKAVQIEYA